MHKLNIAAVAGLLALAAVLGGTALLRTTSLGNAGKHANDAAIAAKSKQLAAYEKKLSQALAAKPPALPSPPAASHGVTPATAVPQQRVVYRRPPPIVVVKHTHHGDDGAEYGDGGGGGGGDG